MFEILVPATEHKGWNKIVNLNYCLEPETHRKAFKPIAAPCVMTLSFDVLVFYRITDVKRVHKIVQFIRLVIVVVCCCFNACSVIKTKKYLYVLLYPFSVTLLSTDPYD